MSNPSSPTRRQVRQRKFDSLEQEVFLNLWRTYDRLRLLESEVFGEYGLSAQQYNTLRLLRTVHPDSMPTLLLGRRLISSAPDITRLLDRLEQLGLLSRERRPENRRVVEVQISQQGQELLDEIHDGVQQCHKRQLGHMTRKDLRQLAELLQTARHPHEDAENLSFVDE
jgi:DNA-binding MarR family transcriptional regulator